MNEPLFGCVVLDKAFLEAAESQAADLADLLTPSDQEEEHVFSPRYQQEMARMLAQQRGGKKKHLLRAASVLLAVCLGLGVTVTQVEAVRQPLAQYFMKMTSEYTSITIEGDVGAQGIPEDTQRLLPRELPKGYTVSDLQAEEWFLSATFEGEDGTLVHYSCMPTGGSTAFDTEDCIFYETQIGPRQAYVSIKQTFHNVLIIMFDNEYTYILSGPISEKEALHIMETVP